MALRFVLSNYPGSYGYRISGNRYYSFHCSVLCFSIVLNKIGKILPIWNTYIGGGLLMIFFGTAVIKQLGLIPEEYVELIGNMVQGDVNILK